MLRPPCSEGWVLCAVGEVARGSVIQGESMWIHILFLERDSRRNKAKEGFFPGL